MNRRSWMFASVAIGATFSLVAPARAQDAAAPVAQPPAEAAAQEGDIITTVVDAVLANAGLALCGLALLAPLVDDGRLTLPFATNTGSWTTQAFQARFRAEALTRPHVRRFREWLGDEAAGTKVWLQQQLRPRRRAR